MATGGADEHEPSNVFVLARAMCSSGRFKVSRKERLKLALVELRDRIQKEFVKVAKGWRVSAQELRRDYSYAYPVPALGQPDALCLEQACHNLIAMLHCDVRREAEESGVPDDMLEVTLIDWLVADATGRERTPPASFIRQAEEGSNGVKEERLPFVLEMLAALRKREPKGACDAAGRKAKPALERQLLEELTTGTERS